MPSQVTLPHSSVAKPARLAAPSHARAWAASLALLLGALVPATAQAYPNEPTGFGKVRFRMTIADVKKIYPNARRAGGTTSAEEEGQGGLTRYVLDDQSVLGLKPCEVDFQFMGNELFEVGFDCGREEKIVKALERHFGPPSSRSEAGVFWSGDKTTVAMNPRARTFSFSDTVLSQEVQTKLLAVVLSGGVRRTPTPAGVAPPQDK